MSRTNISQAQNVDKVSLSQDKQYMMEDDGPKKSRFEKQSIPAPE